MTSNCKHKGLSAVKFYWIIRIQFTIEKLTCKTHPTVQVEVY
jgi:hypothetical protein